MADRCLLYYITDRRQFGGDESVQRRALLAKIAEAARAGVDYIQLREKDLSARALQSLAQEVMRVIREGQGSANSERQTATRLLINSRTDVALAVGADGVHLRSDDVSASVVRAIWNDAVASRLTLTAPDSPQADSSPPPNRPLIAVSCHTLSDVLRAESESAALAVFAPVFEKRAAPGTQPKGLSALRDACAARIPVLALGGVTLENAASCLAAGAAGIAAIRLFQENEIEDVVRVLWGI